MADLSDPIALEEHLAEIKGRLVKFSLTRRFIGELREAMLGDDDGDSREPGQWELILRQDEFIHKHKLESTRRRVLDHFIEEDPHLTAEDRANLDGFRDWHVALLEVLEYRQHSMLARNWVNGWVGEVRANKGIGALRDVARVGDVLMSALVYYGEGAWLSGGQQIVGHEDPEEVVELAASICRRSKPSLVRGNRERVRKAFEFQAERHAGFVEHFGIDTLCGPPAEIVEKLAGFERARLGTVRGADGLTAVERTLREGGRAEDLKVPPMQLTEALENAPRILVVTDPLYGTLLDVESVVLWDAFESGSEKAVRKVAKHLKRYITESEASPLPIRRIAARHPARFSAAVREAFSFARFDSATDLEPLLRRYKGIAADPPRVPDMVVVDRNDPVMAAVFGEQ